MIWIMSIQDFGSDLPDDTTLVFTAPEQLEEVMRTHGINQPTRQLGAGAFQASLASRNAGLVDLFADRYSTGISCYLETPPDGTGILIPTSGSGQFFASGFNLADDQLLISPSGVGSDITCPDQAGSDCISIPESRFLEMLETLCPTVPPPEELTAITVGRHQLTALGSEVVTLLGQAEGHFDEERLVYLLEHTVSLVGCASQHWNACELNGGEARHRVARVARDYIEQNYMNQMRMEDLCRTTGIGVRSLQRAFREYFGINITDYVKTVRLDVIYRALADADPSTTTVAKIGMAHGFAHLGRLSLQFRKRFGESPSMVLSGGARTPPVC
jgi:AraC-like DNA-binding protein